MTPGATTSSLLAAAALAFAGCGGGDDDVGEPIPAATADSLELKLDQFQDAMDSGEACADGAIDARIPALQSEISQLGDQGVGSDVQNALDDGVTNLRSLALDKCNQVDDETETETVPTETVPTETETVPTETVPPPVTETTPPPTIPEPEPPVDEGDGGDQFEPDDGGAGPDGQGPPGQIGKDKDR